MTLPPGEEPILRAFREHYEAILNYAFRMTGNRDDAEDVASHVFLALAEQARLGTFPPTPRPWLFRCASNRVISLSRRRQVSGGAVGEVWRWLTRRVDSSHPARGVETADRSERLRAALLRLRPEDRQVIVLRYDEELEFAEIAAITGLAEASVRSRLSRALERLRGELPREDMP